MKHNYIPLARPYIDEHDKQAVINVLDSRQISLGPTQIQFERVFKSFVKTQYACAVSNGTTGLHLAVRALGLQKGDEVITTSFSFIASTNCLLYEGIKPVFVDIEKDTYNIDPKKIEKAITKKTKAILVVHIFGQPATMDAILKIARKYKLRIIEDACESLGAQYNSKPVGSFGDVSVFAFYANKIITTGEGGMIVTNNKKVYEYCASARNQGRSLTNEWLHHIRLGYNYRMSDMQAALGISQLKKIRFFIEQRRKIALWYNRHLSSISSLTLPQIGKNRSHVWFLYTIRAPQEKRDYLIKQLGKYGVQSKAYFPPIHEQPYIQTKKYFLPETIAVSATTIALPMYVEMQEKDVIYIASVIKKFLP